MDSPKEDGHNSQPTQTLSPTVGASSAEESYTSKDHDIYNARGRGQAAAAVCAPCTVSLYYLTPLYSQGDACNGAWLSTPIADLSPLEG